MCAYECKRVCVRAVSLFVCFFESRLTVIFPSNIFSRGVTGSATSRVVSRARVPHSTASDAMGEASGADSVRKCSRKTVNGYGCAHFNASFTWLFLYCMCLCAYTWMHIFMYVCIKARGSKARRQFATHGHCGELIVDTHSLTHSLTRSLFYPTRLFTDIPTHSW